MIPRGQRRHLVALEAPGPPVPDADGGFTEVYVPLNPALWDCSIQAATARNAERLVAGTIQTSATHLLRGDFHPGITTETRITYRGVQYEVQSVQNDDERDLSLTLICMAISESDSGAQSIAAARRAGPGGRAAATARGVHD